MATESTESTEPLTTLNVFGFPHSRWGVLAVAVQWMKHVTRARERKNKSRLAGLGFPWIRWVPWLFNTLRAAFPENAG